MQRDGEDEAWRAIVENYGDRPELEPDTLSDPAPERADEDPDDAGTSAWAVPAPAYREREPEAEERYVPPPPPPVPRPPRDRLLAWLGVFGAPAVLLLCLVLTIPLPSLITFALVASFVGGFLYLAWHLPREPREPWDDGAQV